MTWRTEHPVLLPPLNYIIGMFMFRAYSQKFFPSCRICGGPRLAWKFQRVDILPMRHTFPLSSSHKIPLRAEGQQKLRYWHAMEEVGQKVTNTAQMEAFTACTIRSRAWVENASWDSILPMLQLAHQSTFLSPNKKNLTLCNGSKLNWQRGFPTSPLLKSLPHIWQRRTNPPYTYWRYKTGP